MRRAATHTQRAATRRGRRLVVGFSIAVVGVLAPSAAGTAWAGTPPPWAADKDFGSTFNISRSIDADHLWGKKASGGGIGVALIDTGVSPVRGLDGGQVVDGPDLSLDAGNPDLRHLDAFGHGTHLAGIIVGRDANARSYGDYNKPKQFTGIAPDATLVNVKVGAADGAVDVSQVIAGIDWVVAHKDDPGLNIRVINLAYGTDSTQGYEVDPLAFAAERAWRAGIVVVTAAGNDGKAHATLTSPATDPLLIAVGADGHYDKDGHKLFVTDFSNAGNPGRDPDLVAPGQSTVSFRDEGSFIDVNFPSGLVNDQGGRFFRGSGTSQATAVVSGAVADLLSRYPSLTPDQVKGVLKANADPLDGVSSSLQGAGEIDLDHLDDLDLRKVPAFTQTFAPSDGSGSLEAARGSSHLVAADGTVLEGETTAFGTAFDGSHWSDNAWDAASWQGGTWSGNSWHGDAWSAHDWSADPYAGPYTTEGWSGSSWHGNSWHGNSWHGNSWHGSSWHGNSWHGNSWHGDDWSGSSWSGDSWG